MDILKRIALVALVAFFGTEALGAFFGRRRRYNYGKLTLNEFKSSYTPWIVWIGLFTAFWMMTSSPH